MPYASDLVANIDADTRKFDRAAAAVDRQLKKLASSDPEVTVNADTRRAQAEIRGVEQALTGIEDESVSVLAETDAATAEIQGVEAALAGIDDQSVAVTADTAAALGEIQSVEAALVGIEDEDVRVTADTKEAAANVQSLEAALAGLEDQTVKVSTETSGLGASFGAAASQSGMLGGALGGVIGKVGSLKAGMVGLAGGAAVAGFTKLAMGAAELDDSLNATNQVFQDSSDIIDDWGSRSVQAVGLSERSFRSLAAPLGALMRSLGATGDEVGNMSTEVISLGADFASVLGGSTEDAVMAIGAAFRGETEPIRRYGITLDAAAVQERALAMGLMDGNGKIKNRAAVIRDLIVEQAQANGYVGDFERTQREGVNAVRMMTNTLSDSADKLGRAFVPMMVQAANETTDFVEALGPLIDGLVRVGEELSAVEEKSPARAGEGLGDWIAGLLGLEEGLINVGKASEDVALKQRIATEDMRDAATASRQGDTALSMYYDSLRTAESAIRQSSEAKRDSATASRTLAGEEDRTREATDKLKESLDRLIGINLSAEQAQIRFEQGLHNVTETIKEQGHHLDSNRKGNLEARSAVVQQVDAALRHVEALKEQNASTRVVSDTLSSYRQRIIDAMVAGGANRAEAEAYINTLGLNKEALDRVSGASQVATGATEVLRGSVERSGGAAGWAGERFGWFRGEVHSVPGDKTVNVHTPGLQEALDNFRSLGGALSSIPGLITVRTKDETGDGPGRPPGGGGNTQRRVQSAMAGIPGLAVTSTYRSPAANRRAGGSPRSYHLDRSNPAVDVGGRAASLDRLNARLRSMGGWREGPIWRAPGHYDHLHVAHGGGRVSQSWYRMPGDGPDERTVRLQVGEQVIPRMHAGGTVGGGGNTYVTVVVQGSLVRERDVARQIDRVMAGSARGRGR